MDDEENSFEAQEQLVENAINRHHSEKIEFKLKRRSQSLGVKRPRQDYLIIQSRHFALS